MIIGRRATAAVRRLLLAAVALLAVLAAACGSSGGPAQTASPTTTNQTPPVTVTSSDANQQAPAERATAAEASHPRSPQSAIGLTYHRPDGNRFAAGRGAMPTAEPLDIPLSGRPAWLVGAPFGGGSLWAVLLEDGRAEAFLVIGRTVELFVLSPAFLPAGMPPVLLVDGDEARLLANPAAASSLTHPTPLASPAGVLAFLEENGDVVLWDEGEMGRLSVAALPDARILSDGAGRLLLLTGPTGRYQHGVLGDAIEASGITLLDSTVSFRVATQITLPEPDVVEGIAPIWADLNGDGRREIIVTVTNGSLGARLVVFDEEGGQLASGPPIGRGFRWRHQIAVAPFGPEGEVELAAVLTPHIGGRVEYYRLSGDELEIVARLAGFSSHALGSRNLDSGLAGDFDGDGQVELALPDQAQQTLNGVFRTAGGADVAWTVAIGGRISTNLAAVTLEGDRLALGAGHDGDGLRIWSP